ncbi:hypothetical protein V0R50_13175 [Pseudomonas sp. 148P]|uniref:Uncharacterized protein n=1 Tax=Pseudomonas ulcerans TaxID=3115852 RepID=A0ABU7HRM1_9PSED|nr:MULTISPECIES: hypothetical protein [unclassified Pseudomonas]MEE1923217.1 hypothetical protein [Pseudomonas sp. 147P]MEE1934179.1 hypothetical protein [Pseudomonas sp. 148P]
MPTKRNVQERFSVSYDAEDGDLKNHKIDAFDLARSILGVHSAVSEANSLMNKGAEIELKVSSPVRRGSVVIDFLLLATTPAALDILKVIGFSATGGAIAGGSLIEVVKKLKGRKVAKVIIESGADLATIEVSGEIIKCDKRIAQLAVDKKVRDSLHSVIQAPISGKKNAIFKVMDENETVVQAVKENAAHNFSPLPIGSLESEEKTKETTTAYFVQVNFESSRGWRVKLADGTEHAVELADEKFLNRVNQNKQTFSKEDLFEVVLQTKSVYRQTRSTHSYTVMEVTKHFADKSRRLI